METDIKLNLDSHLISYQQWFILGHILIAVIPTQIQHDPIKLIPL